MIDIGQLVREALLESGCNEDMLSDFDSHSTIALDFESRPSILIALRDEHVVMFARLMEHNEYILEQSSAKLLQLLMSDVAYSITGKYHLSEHENFTVLNYIVTENALNKNDFSSAIEEFYNNIELYIEALK
ncbi:SPI-1 type III secretion system chaperone SpaK (plasmid) [Pantoea sp. BJ2]|uniref:SPI-1 type III secretion system chaperone SpaK n=1 Tax=Pantoea sp. BJ2 TaxID=3141322 RepID=A0AAU7U3X3_9GAMM